MHTSRTPGSKMHVIYIIFNSYAVSISDIIIFLSLIIYVYCCTNDLLLIKKKSQRNSMIANNYTLIINTLITHSKTVLFKQNLKKYKLRLHRHLT